jgi:hypothetical protein
MTRHMDCGESSLFIFDLRIQWHIFSVYINVFSTLNIKRQDRKTSPGRLSKHDESTGCGGTRIPCDET